MGHAGARECSYARYEHDIPFTQDIIFNTNTDWLSGEIILELDTGTIYQDPGGSNVSPNPAGFGFFPSLEFDTYLSGSPSVSILSGALNLGGSPSARFDVTVLDATWFSLTSNDIGSLTLARVTLSEDASGTWSILAYSAGDGPDAPLGIGGTISGGVMIID